MGDQICYLAHPVEGSRAKLLLRGKGQPVERGPAAMPETLEICLRGRMQILTGAYPTPGRLLAYTFVVARYRVGEELPKRPDGYRVCHPLEVVGVYTVTVGWSEVSDG
jgi:hypothetical protein